MGKDLRLGWFESLFGSWRQSGAGHAFAKAAFFEEILLEPPELLVEKVAGQLDQSDHHIGGDERVGVFDASLEGLVVCARLAVELPEAFGVAVLLGPFLRAAQPQEVAVVFEQFTQTG